MGRPGQSVRSFSPTPIRSVATAAETFAERMARWRLAEAYEAIEMTRAQRVMARDILSYYGIEDAAHIDFERLWASRSDINSPQMAAGSAG